MADSGRGSHQGVLPRMSVASVLVPVVSHSSPPHPPGDPPPVVGKSCSVSYWITSSSWVLMCPLLCVCPPRVESLFPPVLPKSCNQIPLPFKVWFSRNSSSRCWTTRFGSLTWGSEPSLQWLDFCGIIVLQRLWDLILLWLHPSYSLTAASSLSLDVGYHLWWAPVPSCRWLFSS